MAGKGGENMPSKWEKAPKVKPPKAEDTKAKEPAKEPKKTK